MAVDDTRLVNGLHRFAQRAQAGAAPLTQAHARGDPRVPFHEGELVNSIQVSGQVSGGGTSYRIQARATAIQAVTTDKGARPHVIRPRRQGGLLRFPSRSGQIVYARQVNHPGNVARPWWNDVIRDAWRQGLRDAARAAG